MNVVSKLTSIVFSKESIVIGYDIESYIVEDLLRNVPTSTYVLVCDTNVYPVLGQSFEKTFSDVLLESKSSHKRLLTHIIPPGEVSKSRDAVAEVQDWMLSEEHQPPLGREAVIIALGGGVIGDMVGFAASTFMRGVRLVNVPTSLLAMVDSSIGGKNGIDTLVRYYYKSVLFPGNAKTQLFREARI